MEYSIKEYHPGDFLISASDNYLLYLLDIEKTFLAIQKNMTDSKKVDQFFSSIESLFGLDTDFHFMYNECSKILLLNNEASLYLELIEAFEQIQAFINAGIVSKELVYTFIDNISFQSSYKSYVQNIFSKFNDSVIVNEIKNHKF